MKIDLEEIRKNKPISELLRFSIINLDKSSGPTSFSVSQYVKNLLQINKTSHFGTLDPAVTGVLPVALGRACRLNDYFMHRDKTYIGIMRLHEEVSEVLLKEKVKDFIGKITQLPPVRSRVKRAERIREVKSFEILEKEGKDYLFSTKVQAGTYIRKLIHDLGEKIGGAHMLELRRTEAGIFSEPCVSLYDLDKAVEEYKKGDDENLRKILIPAEIVSQVLPVVQIKSKYIKTILTGKPIFNLDLASDVSSFKEGDKVAVFLKEKFIEVARVEKDGDVFAVPEFVFN